MSKRMLIDASHAEETRVVVVDGNRIEEFDFESRGKKQLRGNIYLAKVTRVEPSLQAAFIEYGGNRHGFLAFNEIHPDYYQIPLADREALLREEAEEEDDHHASAHDGDGEDGGGDDEDDVMGEELARRRRRLMRRYKIQEVIKRRQIMLVQVVKEERGNKGAALTTYLSLAGRYCVLMPNTARGGGVSRKITSAADRKRLKTMTQSLETPEGMGLIVRTAGAKRTKAEIKRDYEYLMRLWENIREKTLHSIAPALIYEEEDLVKRAIRDMYDKELEGIVVEGEEGYREAKEFMRMLMPSQAKKIQAYREPTPLFIKARVEDYLAQIYNPVVPLKSGGYLVINQTEALVAVDVNSGKATRERNIEATALKTNMEAAEEAARQLRLRDLAGLIVIDFIDMDEAKNNRAVEKKLKDCLKDDRARIQMGKISAFGLMEISRQRRRSGVLEGSTLVCPHCQGMGRVRSVESSALSILRDVEMEAVRQGPGQIVLRAPTDVALYILNEKRAYLLRLAQVQGLQVAVQIDTAIGASDHQIERLTTLSEEEARAFAPVILPPPKVDDFDDNDVEDEDEEEDVEAEDAAEDDAELTADDHSAVDAEENEGDRSHPRHHDDSARGGRRRRRRRGRRGDEHEAPRVADAAAADAHEDEDEDDHVEGEDQNSRRRRRRGRRGGRRAREEVRTTDPYAWIRIRVPHADGVYTWFDPSLATQAPRPAPADAATYGAAPREPIEPQAESPAAVPVRAAAAPATESSDIWVELPAAEPAKAPRARRGRSRARGARDAEVAVDAVSEAATESPISEAIAAEVSEGSPVETPAAVEKPAAKPRRSRSKAAVAAAAEQAAVAAPEPEPVAAPAAPELVVVASAPPELEAAIAAPVDDPAEISTPPAQPKRGWWRR
ncbi:MAG TPA: ribonuclease E/G [Caulobacteraceae bacterium]|nr:ribonuclease E/G [Caulobacteraceae bacterium]